MCPLRAWGFKSPLRHVDWLSGWIGDGRAAARFVEIQGVAGFRPNSAVPASRPNKGQPGVAEFGRASSVSGLRPSPVSLGSGRVVARFVEPRRWQSSGVVSSHPGGGRVAARFVEPRGWQDEILYHYRVKGQVVARLRRIPGVAGVRRRSVGSRIRRSPGVAGLRRGSSHPGSGGVAAWFRRIPSVAGFRRRSVDGRISAEFLANPV